MVSEASTSKGESLGGQGLHEDRRREMVIREGTSVSKLLGKLGVADTVVIQRWR